MEFKHHNVPFLIILSYLLSKQTCTKEKRGIVIPWFAIFFVVVSGINSLDVVPHVIIEPITMFDTFILTMAMSALGMETSFKKFKGVGGKAMLLAFILFVWLIFGGFFIVKGCSYFL